MKQLMATLTLALTLLGGTLFAAENDIVIADFEGPDYGTWKVEGEAFGKAPAKGGLPGQMQVGGFEGKGLVNSFLGGDGPTGKLTSPPFTIQRDYLSFLIGGGGHKDKTCMNLLVDGEVVRTATGPNIQSGGSEFLNWENWDVKRYKGKEAVLEIVDDSSGGWGHINVDQIVQSDTKAEKKKAPADKPPGPSRVEIELEVTGKNLLLPITGGKGGGNLTVMVGDQLVHRLKCTFAPGKDAVDWWGYLDMSEYQGKTAKLLVIAPEEVAEMIKFGDELPNLQPLYDESLRPQLRFSQKRGWNNDPNGMVYHDGEYHFFWQCNPAGNQWANMYWGHAVSPDMIHWTELPHALRNGGDRVENRHPSMAVRNCFSGSANVDEHNTGGWQTGDEKVMVAAFTDTGCGEALAISNDRGRTWKYIEENPIIRHKGRDPKLVWYEYEEGETPISTEAKQLGGHWVIAVYNEQKPFGRNIAFYTSTNLKDWTEQSHLPGYFECPELFQLPVDGEANNKRWVIFGADARYAIGAFDGKRFTPEHEGKHQVHWGPYYASQCFSRVPGDRVIQVGWARIGMPRMPFNQGFSLPTELTLRTTPDGIRMCAQPVKELEVLREDPLTTDANSITPEKPVRFETEGQLFDIVVEVEPQEAREILLQFGENRVKYNVASSKLDEMPLKLTDGKLKFRVVVDRPMYEVCGGEGNVYKTAPRGGAAGKPISTIQLSASGGEAKINDVRVYPMRSIWKK